MAAYHIYKLIHLVGVLTVFLSVGGLVLYAVDGDERKHPWRKRLFISHGMGIFLVLLGGFGLLTRVGIAWPWPGWVVSKLTIWVILAVLPAVIVRTPSWAKHLWWITLLLGARAVYLVVQKPF